MTTERERLAQRSGLTAKTTDALVDRVAAAIEDMQQITTRTDIIARAALGAANATDTTAGDGWIACADQMPERNTPVLVIERHGDRACCAEWFDVKLPTGTRRFWHQDSEHVEADSGPYGNGATLEHRDLDVIAWRRLPAPPTAGEKETTT